MLRLDGAFTALNDINTSSAQSTNLHDLIRTLGPCSRIDCFTWSLDEVGLTLLRDAVGPARVRVLAACEGTHRGVVQHAKGLDVGLKFFPEHRPCHAKGIIFDTPDALVGSFNLVERSFLQNLEFAVRVREADVQKLSTLFEAWWGVGVTYQDHELSDGRFRWTRSRRPQITVGPRPLQQRLEPDPYQEELIDSILRWIRERLGAYSDTGRLLQLPTGAGKTLIAAEVIHRLLTDIDESARVLWVTHGRHVLLQSMKRVVAQCGDYRPRFYYHYDVEQLHLLEAESKDVIVDINQLASTDEQATVAFCLNRSLSKLKRTDWDLVIVDEAHRYHKDADSYASFDKKLDVRKKAVRLGMTATPRGDEDRNFGEYWDLDTPFGRGITEQYLIEKGFRARIDPRSERRDTGFPFVLAAGVAEDSDGVEAEILRRVSDFDNEKVNSEVLRAFKDHREQCKRILVFAVTIAHADKLALQLGASAKALHSRLSNIEAIQNREWFCKPTKDAPDTRVLVSVLMASEGVDLPEVDALFLVRPTFSPILHSQMVGRGLRGPAVGGTETCVIVDFVHQFLLKERQLAQATLEYSSDASTTTKSRDPADSSAPDHPRSTFSAETWGYREDGWMHVKARSHDSARRTAEERSREKGKRVYVQRRAGGGEWQVVEVWQDGKQLQ